MYSSADPHYLYFFIPIVYVVRSTANMKGSATELSMS